MGTILLAPGYAGARVVESSLHCIAWHDGTDVKHIAYSALEEQRNRGVFGYGNVVRLVS